jgi:outer membrane biosynthesis protein TonB
MNVSDIKRQLGSSGQKPLMLYFWVSIVLHAVFIVGMASSARWLNQPRHDKFSSHTVSLVDAPLSLTDQPSSQGAEATSKVTPAKRAKPSPQAPSKPAKPPRPPQTKKAAVSATPSSAPVAKTKSTTKTKRQPVTSSRESKNAVQRSPSPHKAKAQKTTTTSPQLQPASDETKTDQIRQRQAEQRLAALRARYGSHGEDTPGIRVTENLQRVRLRAYQEFVREQVVEAWILPLRQDNVRRLQATALLTVDREGRIVKPLDKLNRYRHCPRTMVGPFLSLS